MLFLTFFTRYVYVSTVLSVPYPNYFKYRYGIAKILLNLYLYLVLVLDICVLYLVRKLPEASCNVKNARTHHPHVQNTVPVSKISRNVQACQCGYRFLNFYLDGSSAFSDKSHELKGLK